MVLGVSCRRGGSRFIDLSSSGLFCQMLKSESKQLKLPLFASWNLSEASPGLSIKEGSLSKALFLFS